jgi:hypothetical protein
MFNGDFTDYSKIRLVSTPKDYSGTAATTEWFNMSKYNKIRFVIATGAWAGGTAAVTLNQGTADATGSTSLSFSYMYTNDGAPTTDTLTKTTVGSDTFNLDTAASVYVIEVNASMLTAGYDWVSIAIASPASNSDFYCVIAECYAAGYLQGQSSASALT